MALENILARCARVATRIGRQATRVDVVYRRGTASVPIEDVGMGESRFEQASDTESIVTTHRDKDFLIPVETLILGGTPVTPQDGDLIEVDQGAETVMYELAAIGAEPAWRHTDRFETAYRCHTKEYDRKASP